MGSGLRAYPSVMMVMHGCCATYVYCVACWYDGGAPTAGGGTSVPYPPCCGSGWYLLILSHWERVRHGPAMHWLVREVPSRKLVIKYRASK